MQLYCFRGKYNIMPQKLIITVWNTSKSQVMSFSLTCKLHCYAKSTQSISNPSHFPNFLLAVTMFMPRNNGCYSRRLFAFFCLTSINKTLWQIHEILTKLCPCVREVTPDFVNFFPLSRVISVQKRLRMVNVW